MSIPKIKAVLFTSKTLKDGTHPIMIRVTVDRKLTYKSVGYSVPKLAWDEDSQRVFEKKPVLSKRQEGQLNSNKIAELKESYRNAIILSNAGTINSAIVDAVNEAETVKNKLKINDESLDIKNIKAKLNPTTERNRNLSFLAYAIELRDRFKANGSIGTYKNYKTVISKLETYLNNRDLLFKEIDVKFLQNYHTNLITIGNDTNTIYNNLKTIKAIYHNAIREQLIKMDNNPFFIFKFKYDSNIKKEKLNIDEIIKLEEAKLKADSLEWHSNNFFLFSFYCAGIRASDTLNLKWGNITSDNRLEYTMQKTGKFKSIALMPKALNILYNYKKPSSNPESYIFPFVQDEDSLLTKTKYYNLISAKIALINKYLKKVATAAGIEKNISTHIARHSFSDIARKQKTSIYYISTILHLLKSFDLLVLLKI